MVIIEPIVLTCQSIGNIYNLVCLTVLQKFVIYQCFIVFNDHAGKEILYL